MSCCFFCCCAFVTFVGLLVIIFLIRSSLSCTTHAFLQAKGDITTRLTKLQW